MSGLPEHGVPRAQSQPAADPWQPTTDGGLMRVVYVPGGMSVEEARKIVDRVN